MAFPPITGIDLTGTCAEPCCGGETVECCLTDVSTILYCTIASDCAKLDGLVITMTYDPGELKWIGTQSPSVTWCEVRVDAECTGDNKVHVSTIFVNGSPLNLTEVTSECDPVNVVTTGEQNVPEENSCCPGATFTGTITE